ncbi:MAG TPA: hypothetical protein VK858_13655 [Longimicrobiales bacterium]|nr:hypothetical protein [Longimicrobiales bacterium]
MTPARRIPRAVLGVLTAALGLSLASCTGAGVYVGVSGPGPWVGYPPGYIGYPGYVGYPGRIYEEEEQEPEEGGAAVEADREGETPGEVEAPIPADASNTPPTGDPARTDPSTAAPADGPG